MSTIPVENLRIELNASLRLHVDRAEMRAANWVCIEEWVADWPRGAIEIASGWRDANCVLLERPDVCQALELEAGLDWGFILHLLDPAPAPAGQMEASLSRDGAVFAVWILPCPQHVAVLIFGHPRTRIGNYHPDTLEILSRPWAIGLDIGCGLRDRVFDNLVTQDIYPTPTSTIVTRPEDSPHFADGVFDLIVRDSLLEHVPDPVALLTEAHRLLRPGGKIFGDVPFLHPLYRHRIIISILPPTAWSRRPSRQNCNWNTPLSKPTSARNSPWNGCRAP